MRNLQSVQCLRGIAALLVVFHHARNPQAWLYNPLETVGLGQIGVDIFFVISGFIMYSVGRKERPAEFLRRRVVRVVPMYWIATAVLFAVTVNTHFEKLLAIPVAHILESLLFIPHYSPDVPGIWPYLIPGWTLNYEMFFYALFAVGIASRRPLTLTALCLGGFVLAGLLFESPLAPWRTYTDPVILEFLLGMLIAATLQRPNLPTAVALLCVGVVALVTFEMLGLKSTRLLTWGLPCACIVAGLVAFDLRNPVPKIPILSAVGDASYSIYLFQVVALNVASKIFAHVPLTGLPQFILFIAFSLVFAGTAGYLVYRYVEKPILRRFSAHGASRKSQSPSPSVG
jgi:exopolysaccharide production protein ExoZ